MANRRMFSKNIVQTDNFLDMPASTQLLYFHLGIEADDDGFVTPLRVMRMVGAMKDDLNLLIAKSFVMRFEDGVVVIKHWKVNNEIRSDRYKETQYLENKSRLSLFNGQYDLVLPTVLPTVHQLDTQDRLGKDRLGKDRGEEDATLTQNNFSSRKSVTEEVLKELSELYGVPIEFVRDCWDSACNWLDAKGKVQKNYKAFLSNWVKKDKADYILKSKKLTSGGSFKQRGGVYDARTR